MKKRFCPLFFWVLSLCIFFSSCEEDYLEYKKKEPIRITITNISSAIFPSGEILYMGLYETRWGTLCTRGNNTVDSTGTAEITFHTQTGVPWTWYNIWASQIASYESGYDNDDFKFYVRVMEGFNSDKVLYRTKNEQVIRKEETTLTLDFTRDFEKVP